MAYIMTDWKSRIRQYVNRIKLIPVEGTTDTFDVQQIEGTVSQEGVALSPNNLKKIDQGIKDAHDAITQSNLENLRRLFLISDIPGTTQIPTYTASQISKIEHKDAQNVVVRTDTFNFSVANQIQEIRTLSTGETLTFTHYFNGDGTFNRTEVT